MHGDYAPITINYKFGSLQSHQRQSRHKELPLAARLNHIFDTMAHQRLAKTRHNPIHPYPQLPGLQTHATIHRQPVLQNYHQKFTFAIPETALEIYSQQKYQWTEEMIQRVDWETYNGIYIHLPPYLQLFVIKAHSRWLPTNAWLQKTGVQATNRCFSCQSIEDIDHLFKCPNRIGWRQRFLHGLHDRFEEVRVHPETRYCFTSGIKAWFDNTRPPVSDCQHDMGWEHAFTGKLHSEWRRTADAHTRWMRPIARYCIQEFYALWKHRCDIQHNHPNAPKSFRRQELEQKLNSLYNDAEFLLAIDRTVFERPLQELFELPTPEIQAHVDYLTKRVQRGKIQARTSINDIRVYVVQPQSLPDDGPIDEENNLSEQNEVTSDEDDTVSSSNSLTSQNSFHTAQSQIRVNDEKEQAPGFENITTHPILQRKGIRVIFQDNTSAEA